MNLFELYTATVLPPSPAEYVKRGRPTFGAERMSNRQYKKRARDKAREQKLKSIAILDMETDPFDNTSSAAIKPFLAVLYSDEFDPVVIWEEENERFVAKVLDAIENLPGSYTIYAHNGGKFDYMFLLHRLRGFVSFKGRGIMSAKVGRHELRDSFHIIPDRLANIQKDNFDYTKLKRGERDKWRDEIIRYCTNDCAYLLDVVKKFVTEFGLKLSIGQAAMAELRMHYKVKRFGNNQDAFLRNYFFGGRVECLQGRGHFISDDIRGRFQLYDVNSMYPYVMATRRHPVGNQFDVHSGKPNDKTVFLELECRNFGALVRRGDDGEISADYGQGRFRTTIWEYEMALKYRLIENVKIRFCIDFAERSDFSNYILPRYAFRMETKRQLKQMERDGLKGSAAYHDVFKDDIMSKFILNSSYGKFAQNPRKFMECVITDPGELPALDECSSAVTAAAQVLRQAGGDDVEKNINAAVRKEWGYLPGTEHKDYWIWQRPTPHMRFNNVATAASITGAARAVLMEALALADDPVYCDTDSLICRGLNGVSIHNEELGAWKLEHAIDEVLVAGKKLYACKVAGLSDGHKDRIKVRSKGVSGVTWNDLQHIIDTDLVKIMKTNIGPTMTKAGTQSYMRRNIRATVGKQRSRIFYRKAIAS